MGRMLVGPQKGVNTVENINILAYSIKFFYLMAASSYLINRSIWAMRGHAVTQLVDALRYKPEGRGFDSRWCHWNFSLT